MDFPWMDAKSVMIKGSVEAWRAAFPAARAFNVSKRLDIFNSDFVHTRGDAHAWGMHTVNMEQCSGVSEASGLHASARDPDAYYVLVQSGDYHGRSLHAPARSSHA